MIAVHLLVAWIGAGAVVVLLNRLLMGRLLPEVFNQPMRLERWARHLLLYWPVHVFGWLWMLFWISQGYRYRFEGRDIILLSPDGQEVDRETF